MSLETTTKTINGRDYAVAHIPTFESLDVFETLSKLAGPALGAISTAGLESSIEPVAIALFKQLGGGQLRGLMKELLKYATLEREGKSIPLVTLVNVGEYGGKLFELFQVAAFVVEWNYKDFYDGVVTLLASLRPAAAASLSTFPSA